MKIETIEKLFDVLTEEADNLLGVTINSSDTPDSTCMDSLDHVELIMALEERFGFEISDDWIGSNAKTDDAFGKITERFFADFKDKLSK